MSFGEYIYACLLDLYLRVNLLGHRICIRLALIDTSNQFSTVVVLGQLLNLNFHSD